MTDTYNDLPEHRHYYLLRNGEFEPSGPFSSNRLLSMYRASELRSSDFIYFQEWDGWKRMSQVFDLHHNLITDFASEGQDPDILADTYKFMNEHAEPEEELYYIAVQHLPALSITAAVRLTMPKSVILTNRRFCVLEPKLMGETMLEETPIGAIESGVKRIKNGSKNGAFNIVLHSGEWIEINKIPLAQLNRLVELSRYILPSLAGAVTAVA